MPQSPRFVGIIKNNMHLLHLLHRLSLHISGWLMAFIILVPIAVNAGSSFYTVDKATRTGMLVSLTTNAGVVEPSTDKNASSLVGVVGTSESDFDVQPGQISIQTEGVVSVLVSTIGGDIRVGDHISPSLVVGLGAKNVEDGWIVGTAQASLDSTTKGAVAAIVKDSKGVKHDIYTSTIPVLVKVTYFGSPAKATENPDTISRKIQAFTDSIAGKHASAVAVILSFLLLLLGLVVAGRLISTTAKTSIQAISRQPLAKHEIVIRMLQSFALAIGFLIASIAGSLILIRIL